MLGPATQVGARREVPVILTVDAAAMHASDHAVEQGRQRRLVDRPRAARLPGGLVR
jgi:RNA:NAD 2'-phosphotransferase (TPT1/KptA family)